MAQGNRLEVDVVANIRQAQKQIEELTSRPYTLNLNTRGKGFDAPLGKIKGQLGEFEKSLEASNARVLAFGASASAIYALNTALKESVKATIEVEKSLKDINVILNLSDKSLGQFGQSLFNIAKNTGNSFATVATAATELSRQGLGVTDTLKRTQDALILTRLSGLSAADSVEAITASLNGFQTAALTSTQIINKLAAVDASFAVSSADLAEAVKRVGSSAADAGVSFDELIAIVTSAQQITARGGAVIGNSFKTIFTRLQRTETLDALEQLGIQTRTVEGNIRPLIQILSDLAKKYDGLNGVQRAAIAEQVGGVFQINILKAALGDLNKEYSIFSNALKISTGATDEAIRRNEELNTTLSALLNKTVANLTAAGAKIGELSFAPAIKKVLGGVNSILESFTGGDSEDVGSKIGEGLLKGLGNFLSGPGLILGAKLLFGIFQRLTVFTADAVKSLAGLNTKGAEQAQIQQQIFSILQKNPEIIAQINSGQTTLKGLQESILTTIKAQTLAMEQQVTLSKSLASSLASAGVSVSKTGLNVGRLQVKGKASGFIPNLFNQEEASARSMGAVNPKAQMSAGTIGGKKFIKNNKEVEIVGLGSNGDSAVIPTYGSIGDKRQKELYDKLQFLGFVPNFAQTAQQLRATLANANANAAAKTAAAKQLQKLGLPVEEYQKTNKPTGPKTPLKEIPAGNVTVISSYGDRSSKNLDYVEDGTRIRFTGIKSAVPKALLPSDEGNFDTIIKKHLPDAIRGMANDLLNPIKKSFPDDAAIFNSMQSDESAYPQIAGRIFETVISTAINKSLNKAAANADVDEKGNRTWDYSPSDFDDQQIIDALFGPDAAKLKNPYIDAKRSPIGAGTTNIGLRSKLFTTFANKIKNAKAMARGFIPNFAPIQDAMQTEKKMGGDPAIDFEEGIGLYVRDRKTQPNFAAVKRDHPEGIGQAIKNSQKAQESLARGFIPNFKGGLKQSVGKIKGGIKGAFSDEGLSGPLKSVRENALSLSFGLSTLSGVVEQFNKDSKSTFGMVASEALKSASTFSTITSVIPGQVGLIVGAVVALGQAVDNISRNIRNAPLNEIIEKSKQSSENFTKLNDSTQKYAEIFQKLTGLYAQQDPAKAPDIISAQKELYNQLLQIPPEYRGLIASAKNLTELQNAYAKILGEAGKATKKAAQAAQTAEMAKGSSGGFIEDIWSNWQGSLEQAYGQNDPTGLAGGGGLAAGIIGSTMKAVKGNKQYYQSARETESTLKNIFGEDTGNFIANLGVVKAATGTGRAENAQLKRGVFTKYDPTGGGLAQQKAKEYGQNLLSTLDENLLKDLKSKKIDTSNLENFTENLKKYGASADQIASLQEILYGYAGQENMRLLVDQMNILSIEADGSKKKLEQTAEAIKKEAEEQKKLDEIKRKAAEETARLAQDLENMSQAMINAAFSARKMAFTRKSNKAEIATEAFKANIGAESPLLSERAQKNYEYQAASAERQRGFTEKQFSINEEALGQFTENFKSAIDNEIKNLEKAGEKGGVVDQARINQLKSINIAGAIGEGKTGDEIIASLDGLAKQNEISGGNLNTLQTKNNIVLQQLNSKTEELKEENSKQTQIAQAQLKAQLRAIEIQQNLQAVGGPQGFLDPETLTPVYDKFFKGLQNIQVGKRFGMEKMEARGKLESAMATLQLTGGKGSGELNDALKQEIIGPMADSIRQQLLDAASAAEASGQTAQAKVLRERAGEAKQIAADQIDSVLKKDKLPDNVASIQQQMEKLTTNLSQDAMAQGFKNALDGLSLQSNFDKIAELLKINNDISQNVDKQQEARKTISETKDLEEKIKKEYGSIERAREFATATGGGPAQVKGRAKAKELLSQYDKGEQAKKDLEKLKEEEKQLAELRTKTMQSKPPIPVTTPPPKTGGATTGGATTGGAATTTTPPSVQPISEATTQIPQPPDAAAIAKQKAKTKKEAEAALSQVQGLSDTPTGFAYMNQFFKSKEDLEKYLSSVGKGRTGASGGFDPIKELYDQKQAAKMQNLPTQPTTATAGTTAKPNPQLAAAQAGIAENTKQQQDLLARRSAIANKTDPASVKEKEKLDEQLKSLRERNAQAKENLGKLKSQDNPVKAAEERAKGQPSGATSQVNQGEKTERLAAATEKLTETMSQATTAQKEFKNEMNVTFTPLSVDVKGTIETANDELSQKMMVAITKAVEEIAPGIIAKIKGPPTRA